MFYKCSFWDVPFDKLRERFFLLADKYRAHGWAGLQHVDLRSESTTLKKIHGGSFLRQAQGTVFFLAKQCQAMDGGLAARRFAERIYDPQKNPWRDFLRQAQGTFFLLAKQCQAMDGGFAARRFAEQIYDP